MKAQDLWAGHEYAYVDGKPRGVETPSRASRVKMIKIERRRDPWNQRMSTFATVEHLDKETGEPTGKIEVVRARDVFDWWVDYNDRVIDRQRRLAAARAEERRIDQERKEESNKLKVNLHLRTGIPQNLIGFDMYGRIIMEAESIKEWLNA